MGRSLAFRGGGERETSPALLLLALELAAVQHTTGRALTGRDRSASSARSSWWIGVAEGVAGGRITGQRASPIGLELVRTRGIISIPPRPFLGCFVGDDAEHRERKAEADVRRAVRAPPETGIGAERGAVELTR